MSGPTENDRAPRTSVPSVPTRQQPSGGPIRGAIICLLIEAAFAFAFVAGYLAFGADPMRALVPGALAVFFVFAAYVFTVDS